MMDDRRCRNSVIEDDGEDTTVDGGGSGSGSVLVVSD